jgi:hypothetical protein
MNGIARDAQDLTLYMSDDDNEPDPSTLRDSLVNGEPNLAFPAEATTRLHAQLAQQLAPLFSQQETSSVESVLQRIRPNINDEYVID